MVQFRGRAVAPHHWLSRQRVGSCREVRKGRALKADWRTPFRARRRCLSAIPRRPDRIPLRRCYALEDRDRPERISIEHRAIVVLLHESVGARIVFSLDGAVQRGMIEGEKFGWHVLKAPLHRPTCARSRLAGSMAALAPGASKAAEQSLCGDARRSAGPRRRHGA